MQKKIPLSNYPYCYANLCLEVIWYKILFALFLESLSKYRKYCTITQQIVFYRPQFIIRRYCQGLMFESLCLWDLIFNDAKIMHNIPSFLSQTQNLIANNHSLLSLLTLRDINQNATEIRKVTLWKWPLWFLCSFSSNNFKIKVVGYTHQQFFSQINSFTLKICGLEELVSDLSTSYNAKDSVVILVRVILASLIL